MFSIPPRSGKGKWETKFKYHCVDICDGISVLKNNECRHNPIFHIDAQLKIVHICNVISVLKKWCRHNPIFHIDSQLKVVHYILWQRFCVTIGTILNNFNLFQHECLIFWKKTSKSQGFVRRIQIAWDNPRIFWNIKAVLCWKGV